MFLKKIFKKTEELKPHEKETILRVARRLEKALNTKFSPLILYEKEGLGSEDKVVGIFYGLPKKLDTRFYESKNIDSFEQKDNKLIFNKDISYNKEIVHKIKDEFRIRTCLVRHLMIIQIEKIYIIISPIVDLSF